jgi:transcriptional regulator with XRE-family HTH domain
MDSSTTKKLGITFREARVAKGYTQKELADLSGISIRSIQRIENGEIMARSYTLKTLGGLLDIPWEEVASGGEPTPRPPKANRIPKMVLSVSIPLLLVLGSLAFVSQSPRFPETLFEILALVFVVVALTAFLLWWIWRRP